MKTMSDKPMIITRDVERPPGGWRFHVEATDTVLSAGSAHTLRQRVYRHMQANDVPIPRPYQAWFEDTLCRQMELGEPFCGCAPDPEPEFAGNLNWQTVNRFVKTMWQWAVVGKLKMATEEEAQRRADICAACPHNLTLGGCAGCTGLLKRIAETKGARTVSNEDELHNCAVCGCDLKLKVWVDGDALDRAEATNAPPYPSHCWRSQSADQEVREEQYVAAP